MFAVWVSPLNGLMQDAKATQGENLENMNGMEPIDAIILSAGRASRFGVPKILLPAGPGEILLTRVLSLALQVADGRVGVVLGREAAVAQYALERWLRRHPSAGQRVSVVQNPDFAQGQSRSLQVGIRALPDSQGVLVLLADMPGLDAPRLALLRQRIRLRSPWSVAVAPSEGGQMRPPVFLTADLFAEIMRLTGDQGARALLQARSAQVELIEWGTGPWFADVDTWEDYRDLARAHLWASEPFEPLPKVNGSTSEVAALIEATLAVATVPWLAPGLLLISSEGDPCWIELPESYQGVHGLILGPTPNPAAYLDLLRRASLHALAQET